METVPTITVDDLRAYVRRVFTRGDLKIAVVGDTDATTYWMVRDLLARLGARPVTERVVERGKVITAAGVSSGIDMALTLAALLTDETTAQAIQLGIEYDPQPPFDAGAPEKAPAEVVELLRSHSRFIAPSAA